ncbi:MAG: O-antigen ligase family protein [Sedimentisphaerales bacterium]|nr:O-antigen ligase family protein [Sedimentisphaerales bacterium]
MQQKRDYWMEWFLVLVVLLLVCIRNSYSESPHVFTTDPMQALTNQAFSVLLSGLLVVIAGIAGLLFFRRKSILCRRTGLGWGTAFFAIGAVATCVFASDKRSAMTAGLTLAVPMAVALALIGLLHSRQRIKLVLMVITSLGFVNVYQCYEQAGTSNALMIEQYEEDPLSQLGPLGIEPGSFQHMLYEHRLYGRDVKGFFTTGNSAGSFFILVLSAVGCLWSLLPQKNGFFSFIKNNVLFLILLGGIVTGLLLTHSKGAIIAVALGSVGYLLLRFFRPILFPCRYPILILSIVAGMVLTVGIFYYGFTHDRLPGGNSMLVRWQYWRASIRMICDHPLIGVGGGNFRHWYPHYKIPAALETVHDPHNFLLSLWTQFGLLGLAGFLSAVLWPLADLIFGRVRGNSGNVENRAMGPFILVIGSLLAIGMVVIRPFFMEGQATQTQEYRSFVQLYLYGFPAFVFFAGFFLLWFGFHIGGSDTDRKTTHGVIILACGLAAFLLANMIDFAIFEPGIYLTFWILLACLIALRRNEDSSNEATLSLHPGIRYTGLGLVLAGSLAVLFWMVVPVVRAGWLEQLSNRQRDNAHALLTEAGSIDPYDPEPVRRNAKLYLWDYEQTGNREMLENAANLFLSAKARNPAGFKDDSQLAWIYQKMAENRTDQQKKDYLAKAYGHASSAVGKYPGSAKLHIELADLAVKLGQSEQALNHYRQAVQIEDAFRDMFRNMYPGRDIQSRLGEENYQWAKRMIEELTSGL